MDAFSFVEEVIPSLHQEAEYEVFFFFSEDTLQGKTPMKLNSLRWFCVAQFKRLSTIGHSHLTLPNELFILFQLSLLKKQIHIIQTQCFVWKWQKVSFCNSVSGANSNLISAPKINGRFLSIFSAKFFDLIFTETFFFSRAFFLFFFFGSLYRGKNGHASAAKLQK